MVEICQWVYEGPDQRELKVLASVWYSPHVNDTIHLDGKEIGIVVKITHFLDTKAGSQRVQALVDEFPF